jgi:hypothetical protein
LHAWEITTSRDFVNESFGHLEHVCYLLRREQTVAAGLLVWQGHADRRFCARIRDAI